MSARREKHKRPQERALKAERENARLAELLLLHKPPLRCRIRSKLLPYSPSAALLCGLNQRPGKKPERCGRCIENSALQYSTAFVSGLTKTPYPAALAKEVQRIYEEDAG